MPCTGLTPLSSCPQTQSVLSKGNQNDIYKMVPLSTFFAWLASTYSPVLGQQCFSERSFLTPQSKLCHPAMFLIEPILHFKVIIFYGYLKSLLRDFIFRKIERFGCRYHKVPVCKHNSQFPLLLVSASVREFITVNEPIFDTLLSKSREWRPQYSAWESHLDREGPSGLQFMGV